MQKKEYSAAAVKHLFWFAEFRQAVSLMRLGFTMTQIKELAAADNIFSAATPMRSDQIARTVSARVSSLPEVYYKLFEESSLETQKLIALIACLETDALFKDFCFEVYREKLITGDTVLTDADIRMFFINKQRDSEKVASWTDGALDRLRSSYKLYLSEAGLLTRGAGGRKIIKPLIDDRLAALLNSTDKKQILNILTGTR
jgi:hypothetical protein